MRVPVVARISARSFRVGERKAASLLLVIAALERFASHGARESAVYPGVADMLAQLRDNMQLFIVTSKNTAVATHILTVHSLRSHSACNSSPRSESNGVPSPALWKKRSGGLPRVQELAAPIGLNLLGDEFRERAAWSASVLIQKSLAQRQVFPTLRWAELPPASSR